MIVSSRRRKLLKYNDTVYTQQYNVYSIKYNDTVYTQRYGVHPTIQCIPNQIQQYRVYPMIRSIPNKVQRYGVHPMIQRIPNKVLAEECRGKDRMDDDSRKTDASPSPGLRMVVWDNHRSSRGYYVLMITYLSQVKTPSLCDWFVDTSPSYRDSTPTVILSRKSDSMLIGWVGPAARESGNTN